MEIDQDLYKWTVVVAGSCWLLVCGAVALVRMAHRARGRQWRLQLFPWLHALAAKCGGLLPGRNQAPPFMRQAAKKLNKRRLEQAHFLIPWGQVASVIHMASVVSRTAMTLDKHFATSASADSLDPRFASVSVVQDFVVFAVTLQVSLMWALPSLVTLKTLDKWYSGMMAGLVIWISPLAIRSDLVIEYAIGVWTIGLCFSLFNLELYLNVIWLVLLTAMASVTILFGERASEAPSNRQPIHEVVGLTVSSIMIAMVLHGINNFVSEVVRLELEASVSRNELAAARSVLRGVCDVVVELDEAFRLQGESLKLIDMLLLNPMRSIAGEDIRGFLHSDQDRDKFTEQMSRAALPESDEAGLCAAFNVRMKDGAGIPLAVEAFGVRFVDPEGRQMFFVGIREFTDTAPMIKDAEHPTEEALRTCNFGGRNCGREAEWPQPDWRRSSREGDWAPYDERPMFAIPEVGNQLIDSESDTSTVSSFAESEAVIAVWFDCLSPSYRVASVSTGFQMSIGFSEKDDANLLPWIRPDQQEEFIQWVQTVRFSLSNPKEGPESTSVYRDLYISPMCLRRCKMAVSTIVKLDSAQPYVNQWCGGNAPPRCPNGCVMEKSDKTASAGTHYTCDSCGGCSRRWHLQGTTERWKCEACNYDLCFACHVETQDIVRLVIENPTWLSRRTKSRRRRTTGAQGAPHGTPHGGAPGRRLGCTTSL